MTRALPARKRIASKPTHKVRPSVISDRPAKRLAGQDGHAAATVREALRKKGTVFISPAAEARWAHQLLGGEFLRLCERERYGAWSDDPVAIFEMKSNVRSWMWVLELVMRGVGKCAF